MSKSFVWIKDSLAVLLNAVHFLQGYDDPFVYHLDIWKLLSYCGEKEEEAAPGQALTNTHSLPLSSSPVSLWHSHGSVSFSLKNVTCLDNEALAEWAQ